MASRFQRLATVPWLMTNASLPGTSPLPLSFKSKHTISATHLAGGLARREGKPRARRPAKCMSSDSLFRNGGWQFGRRNARLRAEGAAQRQPQNELGALAGRALHQDVAAVLAQDLAADGQPQARPLRAFSADERTED